MSGGQADLPCSSQDQLLRHSSQDTSSQQKGSETEPEWTKPRSFTPVQPGPRGDARTRAICRSRPRPLRERPGQRTNPIPNARLRSGSCARNFSRSFSACSFFLTGFVSRTNSPAPSRKYTTQPGLCMRKFYRATKSLSRKQRDLRDSLPKTITPIAAEDGNGRPKGPGAAAMDCATRPGQRPFASANRGCTGLDSDDRGSEIVQRSAVDASS